MSNDRDYDQTAESIAGIPTPPDNENIGPADSLNEWVEAIMDSIRLDFTGADELTARRPDDRS